MKREVGIVAFIVFHLIGMCVLYGLCKTLTAVGQQKWVFPVWVAGIPLNSALRLLHQSGLFHE
jgi:hypothetical protein